MEKITKDNELIRNNLACTLERVNNNSGYNVESLEIDLDLTEFENGGVLRYISAALPNLKTLVIKGAVLVTPKIVITDFPDSIDTLYLVNCSIVDVHMGSDEGRRRFFHNFHEMPNLKVLRLVGCVEFDFQNYPVPVEDLTKCFKGKGVIEKVIFEDTEDNANALMDELALKSLSAPRSSVKRETTNVNWHSGTVTVTYEQVIPPTPVIDRERMESICENQEKIHPGTLHAVIIADELTDPTILWRLHEQAPKLKKLTIKDCAIHVEGNWMPLSLEMLQLYGCKIVDKPEENKYFAEGLLDLPRLREIHTFLCRDALGDNYCIPDRVSVVSKCLTGNAPIEKITFQGTQSGVDNLRRSANGCFSKGSYFPFYKRAITSISIDDVSQLVSILFTPTFQHAFRH